MIVGLGLEAALVELMVILLRVDALSPTTMATVMLVLVVTLVWVVVRLVVGGALALLFLRLVLTEVRKGMRAGGVSETTARMFVVLRTVLVLEGLTVEGGRLSLLVA